MKIEPQRRQERQKLSFLLDTESNIIPYLQLEESNIKHEYYDKK